MSKEHTYNLHLKGFVGGADFDRNYVDFVLGSAKGTVNVLIDSLGGSLATGLSISAAFKSHGDVNVHFVGMNASAATIASLGAKHISIDAGAMYLVHKCSTAFFEWGSLNADQFGQLIADCEKIKADLDKIDLNVASIYARKCKKPTADLLALMQRGGWLSAQDALDWGFVDEVTDLADDPAPKLTDAVAADMANAGIPIPNVPLADERESPFAKFFAEAKRLRDNLAAIASLFKSQPINNVIAPMKKTYSLLCALLSVEALALTDNKASLSDEQLSAIEEELKAKAEALAAKDAAIADLQAKLASRPAADTTAVVEDNKPGESTPKNDVEQFVDTYNSARQLFNEV